MLHYGYKTLITRDGKLCIALLRIPDNAKTNEARPRIVDRLKSNFRCDRAIVVSITTLDGEELSEAYSQFDETFKYTVGVEIVIEDYNPNINDVQEKGIHYCLSQVIYIHNPSKIKYTGHYVEYYDNGIKVSECDYVDGIRNGHFVEYYENGKTHVEYDYVDGKLHGRYVEYRKNGQIISESDYIDGIPSMTDSENNSGKMCEDCGCLRDELIKEPACSDYHTSGHICCYKYVCENGCNFICDTCLIENIVDKCDGYAIGFKCWKCLNITDIKIYWYGHSIMESCQRYCSCCLHEWDGVAEGLRVSDRYDP